MTLDEPETRETEAERVVRWRIEQLVRAGFDDVICGSGGNDLLSAGHGADYPYPSTPAEDRCFRGDKTVGCPTFHPRWIVE
jgi:hypothetical protein